MAEGWGIFDENGQSVFPTASVWGIEETTDYLTSDYPQEEGVFETYNKVLVPFTVKVILLAGGTVEQRRDFMYALRILTDSMALVTVAMPDTELANANLVHFSYRREARAGVTLLRIEVWCKEVRKPEGGAQFSDTQSPNGAAVQDNGEERPAQPTAPEYENGVEIPGAPLEPPAQHEPAYEHAVIEPPGGENDNALPSEPDEPGV